MKICFKLFRELWPVEFCVPVRCQPNEQKVTASNLFASPHETKFTERDSKTSYKRQKPVELYKKLLQIFSTDKTLHIVDTCSGASSCAVASNVLGLKAIILEKSELKVRLIMQKI